MFRHGKKELWLISKHGNDTGDNAFVFFKYMVRMHPEIRSVYVADRSNERDWKEACETGETVQFRSLRHKLLFLSADKIITSHVGDSEPWDYDKVIERREKHPGWKKKHRIIHLQHGVIDKNISHIYDKSKRPVDLFISSTSKEKEYIKKSLHYSEEEVALTGLARFDELYGSEPEKMILLIPRYRREVMVQLPENKKKLKYHFMNSRFYRTYQSLLDNASLKEMLERRGYKLVFYPHYEVQPLIGCFHSESQNVIIADRNVYDLDELLKKSALMITDYSSIAFDFGFMKRPVIYYQFDQEEFETEHGGSYFDHKRDGFGPVVDTEQECVDAIRSFMDGNLDLDGVYIKRCEDTFEFLDSDNCKRIYERIMEI